MVKGSSKRKRGVLTVSLRTVSTPPSPSTVEVEVEYNFYCTSMRLTQECVAMNLLCVAMNLLCVAMNLLCVAMNLL